MNINKNISVWRGNNTPPTDYHLWIKDDGSQFLNINNKWILQSNDSNKDIINVSKLFNNYNISLDQILLLLSNYDNIPIHQGIILRFKETNQWKEYILIDSDYKLKTNWKLISVSDLLDDSEKINSNYLPSYVDDVLEFDWLSQFPTKGESGKIYIEKQPNTSYRWTGNHYEMIATASTASELKRGLMDSSDKRALNLIRQETLFHPIININQICPNQGQGDNKDRWLISYAIEAAWNWIKANPNRNIYLSPGLSIMFRSTNVRATNGFDGPFLVFTYTSTNFSENEFKTDSNWCRTLSEADLNYELADSQYDGFLSKTDWTRFNNATSTINNHVTNFQNPHHTNKSQIGLSNVTNDAQVKRSEMGANNGVATLDSSGKVVTSQLPSFVDDVLEFESKTAFPATGESGKIYVSLDTNLTYRWGGTEYVEISKSLALGETSSTAYAGNKGKAATDNINKIKSTTLSHIDDTTPVTYSTSKVTVNYECYEGDQYGSTGTKHGADIAAASETTAGVMTAADKSKLNAIEAGAQINTVTGVKGNSENSYRTGNINITPTNIGLGNVDNTSDADKPVSTAQQTALNKKVDKTYVDEQLETKADKADVDEQRISYVSPCFADCTETHEAKLKSITLAASIIPSKAIFSITLKIANNLTLLNQSPVYMHLVDISGNVIGVSQNAVKQVQNKGKYVTWFFDSAINTTEASFVIKLYTTNSASNANDSNFVGIIAHVSKGGGVEGIGVTSDDGTYHTDWTPAIGINVVNLAAIYPQIKELQKYRMAYATSELPDISTTGHKANINEIRISQNTMGISLVSSVSIMVASDNAYSGELYLKVHDIDGNLVATSNNSVNLSHHLGAYVTWYFTPFQLTDDAIYRFTAWDNFKQIMRIHVASGKNEGITCFDQNDSPHTDYCPALGMNVSAIFASDLYKNIEDINNKTKDTTNKLNTHLENYNNPHQVTKAQIGLSNVDNTSDLEKPISNAVQAALDEKISELYFGRYGITSSYNVMTFNLRFDTNPNILSLNDPNNETLAACSFPLATTEDDGLFSRHDYSKLNGIESGAQVNTITGIKGNNESVYRTGNINITKDNIGLGNVDNTSDLNKPISIATQTALDKKANKSTTLAGYGITDAKIDNNGTITLDTVSIEVMTNDEINAMFV